MKHERLDLDPLHCAFPDLLHQQARQLEPLQALGLLVMWAVPHNFSISGLGMSREIDGGYKATRPESVVLQDDEVLQVVLCERCH